MDAGSIICIVLIAVGIVIYCVAFWKCDREIRAENCDKDVKEVMRKYSAMRPEEVNCSTIPSFHKELRNCFKSNRAYSRYLGFWGSDRQLEILRIDFMLLSYYQMNEEEEEDR